MAEVCLQRPCIVSSVGERIAAGMPEHVRVGFEPELGFRPCSLDHPGETGGGKWRAPLRREDEERFWRLFALEPP